MLLPYTHPDLMAGRDEELEVLRVHLRMPVPILGLGAPSGTGKSSLLLGGLVPTLHAEGYPVALVRHPREPGVAGRLLGDLLDGIQDNVADDDYRAFVRRLTEVERLAGQAPLLVLDQFEDVLRPEATAARARLGVLLAATAQRRPGIDEPLCRWLLAYRNEGFLDRRLENPCRFADVVLRARRRCPQGRQGPGVEAVGAREVMRQGFGSELVAGVA